MRAIDADELMEYVWRDKLDSRESIAKMIENAPTVKEKAYRKGYTRQKARHRMPKIVIELPDDDYQRRENDGDISKYIVEEALSDGIPLEKVLVDIKAEIESKLYRDDQVQNNIDALTMSVYNNAILDALSIIDSHISGKEIDET